MIAIDAVPAAKKNKTGVEWYVYQLLRHMNELEPELDVILYSNRPLDFALKGKWKNKVLKWPFPGWSKIRWSFELLRDKPSVIFVPGDELPSILPGKIITTIHDLGFRHHPEYYSADQKKRLERAHRRAVEKVDAFITITDVTKTDFVNEFAANPDRCTTIHLGYDSRMFKPRSSDDPDIARVLKKFDIVSPYLFYVGRLEKKKGLLYFLREFIAWKDYTKTDIELVIGGSAGNVGYEEIHEIIKGREDVHEIGHVEYEDLGPLRSGAIAEVFPTRFEGFGMPAIEAMASGTPFICSDLEVLREVGGDVPLYVRPAVEGAWVRALNKILDIKVRNEMSKKGLKFVKKYDWKKTARKTLDILCNI